MSFVLKRYLETQQAQVEKLLRAQLEGIRGQVAPRLFEAMTYSLYDGGKRLRPILCLAFAQANQGVVGCADAAACAVEMVHTYSLIHDDLPAMDDDALRRGRPTSHVQFGEAMAILAGDALLTHAFSVLARGGPPENVAELGDAAGPLGMVSGQVLDIDDARAPELAYLKRLHQLKTGRLIKAACRMGVRSAGGDAKALAMAEVYGESLGMAFQVMDDVLDVTSTASAMGKTTGSDAAAGRATVPSVMGVEAAISLAKQECQRAIAALEPWGERASPLRALAEYVVERTH